MKIVIFEAARLGDFIESTPLIAGILKSYPGADAGVIALEKSVLEALRLFFPGLPGRLASLPGIGWPGEPDSPKDAGLNDADLENADLLINLSVSPAALEIVESLKPRMVLGPRRNSRGEPEVPPAQKLAMATLALNRRLSRLNLSDIWRSLDPNSPTRLAVPALSPDDLEKAEEVLFAGLPPGLREDIGRGLPLAAFHLGAKNRLRRWPVENHAKLAGLIFKRKPFAAVTLGSREEIPLCLGFGKFRRELCPDVPLINLGGKTDLRTLAAVLGRCSLLVSSDTGVAHLGASLGIPELTVFMGPAFGHETGPYNENSRVLQGLAPCGPCAENRSCDGKRCLAVPPPEEALPLALAALGEKPEEPAPARDESRGRILSHKSEIRGGLMNLRPSDPRPEPLDNESLSAMVIKEGIRKALYADGRPGDAAKGAISGFGGAAPEKTTPRGGNPAAKPVSDGTEREKNPVLEFYPDPKPAEPLNLAKIRFNADYVARVGLDANPEIRKAFEETTEGCLGELFSSKGKFLH